MAHREPAEWDLQSGEVVSSFMALRDSLTYHFCPRQRGWQRDVKNALENLGCFGALPRHYSLCVRRGEVLVWAGVRLHSGCFATPTFGHSKELRRGGKRAMLGQCLPRL